MHLFTARPAVRWRYDGPVSSQVKGPGQNPPVGAVLHYWLKDEPKGDVVLEVLDEKGAVVRKLTSRKVEPETPPDDPDPGWDESEKKPLPKAAGLQRAVWDLRHEGATPIKPAKIDSGDPAEGPMVLPGTYTARLTVDGQAYSTPVEVRLDPRVAVSRGRPRGAAGLRPGAAGGPDAALRDRPRPAVGARAGEGPRGAGERIGPTPRRSSRRRTRSSRSATLSRRGSTTRRRRSATTSWRGRAGPGSTRASRRSTRGRTTATAGPPRACARSTPS